MLLEKDFKWKIYRQNNNPSNPIKFLYMIVDDKIRKEADIFIIEPQEELDETGEKISSDYKYFVLKEMKCKKLNEEVYLLDTDNVYRTIDGYTIKDNFFGSVDGYELNPMSTRNYGVVYRNVNAAMKRSYNNFVKCNDNMAKHLSSYEWKRFIDAKFVPESKHELWDDVKYNFKNKFRDMIV